MATVIVILEPRKIKSATISIVSPSIFHEVMGPDAMIFVFWMFSLYLLSFFWEHWINLDFFYDGVKGT